MSVTLLKMAENRFRLRVETKDEFGKRKFQYEMIKGSLAEAEVRREQLKRGANVSTERSYTFNEYFERWIEDRVAFEEIRDTTAHGYRQVTRRFADLLGHKRMNDFTRADFDNAYRVLISRVNAAHVRYIAKIVRIIFKSAFENGVISFNPAILAKAPSAKWQEKKITLSKDQMESLVEHSREWNIEGSAVRFALATGCRCGEICGVQWQDVNFAKGTVSIRRSVREIGNIRRVGAPKTKTSIRTIALPAAMLEELKARAGNPNDWVFPSNHGSMLSPSALSHNTSRKFKNIGLTEFSMHDLRHAHATFLLQQRLPLKAVSQRLGHSNANITLTVYAHVMPGDDEVLAGTINHIL